MHGHMWVHLEKFTDPRQAAEKIFMECVDQDANRVFV